MNNPTVTVGTMNINIDTQQVKNLGVSIASQNNELNRILMEIEACMREIDQTWNSPAGDEMASAFTKIKPDFENSTNLINKYAKFLQLVAETYEETENRIKQGSTSFGV